MKNGKSTQFSKSNQPSNKAKSQGWARRRVRNEFMDLTTTYQDMSLLEFERLAKEVYGNKDSYTVKEVMAIKYVEKILSSEKFLIDWVDRHIGKPSSDNMQAEDSKDSEITGWTLEIIDRTEDIE